ncbi:MAG: hypothetical protein KY476_12265 [Planctomycetes bacterium]|nr:hypothetical protein [Planctomycetota bacterium]
MTRVGFYVAAALLLGAAVFGGWWLFGRPSASEAPARGETQPLAGSFDDEALRPRVVEFCGACHAVPRPEYFRKRDWPREVQQGYDFYFASDRKLDVPPLGQVIEFYRRQAPEELEFEPPRTSGDSSPVEFRPEPLAAESTPDGQAPAVAHLGRFDLGGGLGRSLVACDMRTGGLWAVAPAATARRRTGGRRRHRSCGGRSRQFSARRPRTRPRAVAAARFVGGL